jgi:hypothetical protein
MTLLLAGAATACGLSLTGSGSSDSQSKPAAQPAPDAKTAEFHVTTVACGTATCVADQQVCCVGTVYSACVDRSVGSCGIFADAGAGGAPPPPPLECTTYRSCGEEQDCCYEPDKGSYCASECPGGAALLCELATDGCGGDSRECAALDKSPLPGIGSCVSSENQKQK